MRLHPGEKFLSIYVADVTQRKDQEAQLARLSAEVESQAKLFDAALSNITDLAYVFDSDARFIYVNRPLLELFGLPSSEVIGKNLFELDYPPELAKRLNKEIHSVLATGKSIRGETYFTAADSSEDHHEYIFNPVFGENGKVVAVAGSTRLTTERKNAEASMRRLAAIVESSDDAIISKDINGIITSWNKAAERMLGYKPEEVIGRSITMLIPEGRGDEMYRILDRVRRSEHVDHYETVRRRKDGTLIEVSLTVSSQGLRGQCHRSFEDRPRHQREKSARGRPSPSQGGRRSRQCFEGPISRRAQPRTSYSAHPGVDGSQHARTRPCDA